MGDKTGISWTDATWNCVRGCTRVSEGCRHCYAEVQAARIVRMGKGKPTAYDGLVRTVGGEARWTGKVVLDARALAQPLRWKRPRRVFANSMSDLFHEGLTNEQIAAVFGVMAASPQHSFQVLTKRAKRMREWFEWVDDHGTEQLAIEAMMHMGDTFEGRICGGYGWPLRNVWLGVSVENQEAADDRIPELLRTPAAVRFLSCEPLLGPVDIALAAINEACSECGERVRGFNRGCVGMYSCGCTTEGAEDGKPIEMPSWVIGGCESGPGARPCPVDWLRSLRDQCAAAGVPYFLKQAVGTVHDCHESRGLGAVEAGAGSKRKVGGVIELPYLDGIQHAAFPR